MTVVRVQDDRAAGLAARRPDRRGRECCRPHHRGGVCLCDRALRRGRVGLAPRSRRRRGKSARLRLAGVLPCARVTGSGAVQFCATLAARGRNGGKPAVAAARTARGVPARFRSRRSSHAARAVRSEQRRGGSRDHLPHRSSRSPAARLAARKDDSRSRVEYQPVLSPCPLRARAGRSSRRKLRCGAGRSDRGASARAQAERRTASPSHGSRAVAAGRRRIGHAADRHRSVRAGGCATRSCAAAPRQDLLRARPPGGCTLGVRRRHRRGPHGTRCAARPDAHRGPGGRGED